MSQAVIQKQVDLNANRNQKKTRILDREMVILIKEEAGHPKMIDFVEILEDKEMILISTPEIETEVLGTLL